jgi:hypothetical protein
MKTHLSARMASVMLAIALGTSALTCLAQNARGSLRSTIPLQPFAGAGGTGGSGYEEIPLSPTSWYVAYFGRSNTSQAEVEAAWQARAAQLCMSVRLGYFAQLRYAYEPVLAAKHTLFHATASPGHLYRVVILLNYAQLAADSLPRSTAEADVPHKMAAILCVSAPDRLLAPTRAVSVSAALALARKQGIDISAAAAAPGGRLASTSGGGAQ